MAIIMNDSTVKSLKEWLSSFPDNAKIIFQDPATDQSKELVICCNFEHQKEHNLVMLTSGFILDPDKFGRTEREIIADEQRNQLEAEGDFSKSAPEGK